MRKRTRIVDEYRALEKRVRAALREDLTEAEFNALALDIHAFQLRHNAPFAKWCAALPTPTNWRELPAVPQAMFKRFRLSCFPPRLTPVTFRTSGTTGETRGEHHFHDTALYEASLLAAWRRLKLPRLPSLFLAQTPDEAPDSSLAHMFGVLAEHATTRAKFDIHTDTASLRRLAARGPCAIFGTALAFLALFERMGKERLRLPRGSFALETGGYKGSGRDIPKSDLYAMFTEFLGLPPDAVWNEYGMTELSSQAYTRGLGRPHESPPWLRSQVVDPETGREVPIGRRGVLRLFDLANVASVLAIQTADIAVRRGNGFELIGRDPAAVPRGCSRRADEILRTPPNTQTIHFAMPVEKAPRSKPRPRRTGISDSLPDTAARARAIAKAATAFPFLGKVTASGLLALVKSELGHAAALDRFVRIGSRLSRAHAPGRLLHVLSGNTPAAALQSLIRGLLLGSENLCKLPGGGIPEVGRFLSRLPRSLADRVHCSEELSEPWLHLADAAVIFGRDETVRTIRALLQPGIPVVEHGHRISLAMVSADPQFRSVRGLVRDIAAFDQHGCLSPHAVLVKESGTFTAQRYAARLAETMARFEKSTPRGPLTLSEANAIRSLREETAFRAANGEPLELFASADTAWTVILDRTDSLPLSPGNRVLFVKPLANLSPLFERHHAHLSTCGIWPADHTLRDLAAALGFSRICPIGKMQQPPLDWHHDGHAVLAPLVRWIDFEQ